MSEKAANSKNKFILIGAIAVLAIAALFFFLKSGGGVSAAEVIERYKQELTLLEPYMTIEPKNISADTSNNAATLTDVTFRFRDVPEITLVVDKIEQSGLDDASYRGEYGDVTTIAKQSFTGLKIFMQGQQIGILEEYTEENIRLNYRDLRAALLAAKNGGSSEEEMALALMPALKDYYVGRAFAKNFSMNVMFVSASIASMEGRDMSMTSYGPGSIDKIEVSAMGQKVFSMDKMAFDSVAMPSIFRDMMSDPESFMNNNPQLMHQAQTDPLSVLAPMSVRGFRIDNLMVNSGSPMFLNSITGDFNVEKDGLSLTGNMDNLTLTRDFLAQTPDLAIIADIVDDQLNLDAKFDFSMKHPADLVDITLDTAVSDKTLGGFALDIAMDMPKNELYGSNNNRELQRVKSFGVSVENSGIIDFLVACYAAVEMYDFEEAYEELLDELYMMEEEAENKMQLEAAQAIIQMVEEGGTLNISFKPSSPMSLADMEAVDENNLEAAGFKVTYTPPKN